MERMIRLFCRLDLGCQFKDGSEYNPFFKACLWRAAQFQGLLLGGSPHLLSKLVTPVWNHLGHLEGKQPQLGDFLTMITNHLLNGMILQVEI